LYTATSWKFSAKKGHQLRREASGVLTEGFNFVKDVPADVRVEILSLIKAVDYPACWQNRGSLTPRVPPIGLKGAFNSR
jgi:hypothetical protein